MYLMRFTWFSTRGLGLPRLRRGTFGSRWTTSANMLPNRLRVSKQATDSLKQLKSRTGLTPNLLCRMAMTLSLEEGVAGGQRKTDLDGSEFNLPTLLGDHALAYECLIR